MSESLFFLIFSILVIAVMLVDLGIFKKAGAAEVTFKEAGFWTGAWVLLAVSFYFFLRQFGGMVHGITDVNGLIAVKELYAPHIELGMGTFADQLTIFQNNLSLEFITG